MQTLIELYDERPLENVLGVEVFRPERVVYVCPDDFHDEKRIRAKLEAYFRHRGLTPELVFARARVYETEAMLTLFRGIVRQYPDCALDITGGTDAVLFAAGLLCAETGIPVFTYSRKRKDTLSFGTISRFCRKPIFSMACRASTGASIREPRSPLTR